MPYRFAQRLFLSCAGALLVCVVLFLLPGLPTYSHLICCGYSMYFPFLCLLILLSLFSSIAWLFPRDACMGYQPRASCVQMYLVSVVHLSLGVCA